MAERDRRTVRDLRRGNRARVLQRLYFDGPLSRQELGPATGLSSGSISNVVAELAAEGLLQEAGIVDSDGGRPRTLLRVAPDGGLLVGIDIGETRVRVELFDLSLTELARTERLLAQHGYDVDRIVAHVRTGVADVLRDAGADPRRLLGIGIGVPGIVEREGPEGPDGRRTAVVHGQTIGWHAVPFEQLLREAVDVPPKCPSPSTTAPRRSAGPRCGSAAGGARAPPPSRSSAPASAPASTAATSWRRTARASRSNGATPRSSCAAAGAAAARPAAWRRTPVRRPCANGGARRAARSPRTPTTRPPSPPFSPPPTRPRRTRSGPGRPLPPRRDRRMPRRGPGRPGQPLPARTHPARRLGGPAARPPPAPRDPPVRGRLRPAPRCGPHHHRDGPPRPGRGDRRRRHPPPGRLPDPRRQPPGHRDPPPGRQWCPRAYGHRDGTEPEPYDGELSTGPVPYGGGSSTGLGPAPTPTPVPPAPVRR